jgi:O-antigen/teichoic acid export membrane protein
MRVLAVRSFGVAALFGFELTVARSLGVSGYGAFSVAVATATIVSRLASLGWLNASTRLISAFLASARYGLVKGAIILGHTALAIGLLTAALLLGMGARLEFGAELPALHYLLPLSAGLGLLELHRHVLRGLNAGELGEALIVLLLPGMAAIAIWTAGVRSPGPATLLYTLVALALVLFSTVAIGRRLPAAVWAAPAQFRVREWSLAALAMLLGTASDELAARTPVLVLGALGESQEAGLYQAAARLALMTVFVLRAVTPVAAPQISRLYHEGRMAELRRTFRRLCLISFAGALPFSLTFLLLPRTILGWFGHDFVAAAPTLRVLGLGYLASAAAGPCATGLMMIGRERLYGMVAAATLLLNVVGVAVLGRSFGGFGAALATAAVMALNNGLFVAVFFRSTAGPDGRRSD